MPSKRVLEAAESILSTLRDDPGWFLYDALNKAVPLGMKLKPLGEMDEHLRALLVVHVSDMYLWRAEGKVDAADAAIMFEENPELRKLLE